LVPEACPDLRAGARKFAMARVRWLTKISNRVRLLLIVEGEFGSHRVFSHRNYL
jgi:hypothetical protein